MARVSCARMLSAVSGEALELAQSREPEPLELAQSALESNSGRITGSGPSEWRSPLNHWPGAAARQA
jgi:hypothetical protein